MSLSFLPKLVKTGSLANMSVRGLAPGQDYRAVISPVREKDRTLVYEGEASDYGSLAWGQPVDWAGDAAVDIFVSGNSQPFCTFHIYALAPEMANLRPLRCDFHIHTTYSDGKSSPAEMAVRGRELGLDALAITDHNYYPASLEAIEFVRKSGLGINCFPGEEVTSSTWHMLSIGANGPVGYHDIGPEGPITFTDEQDSYAAMQKILGIIHQRGGKAFLAHPYWIAGGRMHEPVREYERLLVEGGIEGIELLGDVPWEENLRSLARYSEFESKGKLAILGNSDTHAAAHTFGSYWTLVFARSNSQEDILAAILGHRSVACMIMPMGPASHPVISRLLAFGPFELVDLALFLHEHYFPQHDALCLQEAELGRRYLGGDIHSESSVKPVQAALETYYSQSFGLAARNRLAGENL
jgi:predicted metal-dependent phosphoesterase TrpH